MPADDDDEPHDPVTVWLEQLKAGDAAAVPALWHGYFARLVALARQWLRAVPQVVVHGEDVALRAFDSFCQGAAAGRFPKRDDRDDLWRLLFVLTVRKARGQVRHETRAKRGGGRWFRPETATRTSPRGHSAGSRRRRSPPRWRTSAADCSPS